MAKALKLEENLYINMDSVIEFFVDEKSLRITTNAHPELAFYQIAQEDSDAYGEIWVPVNELHRIKRELGEYMGVKLHVEKENDEDASIITDSEVIN
ncbi:TPA: hypothetical protein I7693_22075 [Vibrio vulnificus]|nr:hypothetical protein [Vibrio vulnificus]HAS8115953.1 hypothetical protein [Vibrio vulnificus]HAS8210284.1 hypothetical protein [Vibrio vulnificus]HAS8331328.1 hypothetical protein [Vibrio vulnificus]HCH3381905.1 hypothetical protein [Vibrio parahaemolyticus]